MQRMIPNLWRCIISPYTGTKYASCRNFWSSVARTERGLWCGSAYSSNFFFLDWRSYSYKRVIEEKEQKQHGLIPTSQLKPTDELERAQGSEKELAKQPGKNITATEKRKFLVNTLIDLKDSKEAVYGTLDAWVAWEQNFPLASLKQALFVLEKEEQWHRVVQVVKWMLSKGQGTTMGTYQQLIRALEKDNRAEEAHEFWMRKINHDLHSVPWRFCDLMLSIYYRNNMLDRLVKLFKNLESFERKPPYKSIVRKVADAYEVLGKLEEKEKLLVKYNQLFNEPSDDHKKKEKKSHKVMKNNVKAAPDMKGYESTSLRLPDSSRLSKEAMDANAG